MWLDGKPVEQPLEIMHYPSPGGDPETHPRGITGGNTPGEKARGHVIAHPYVNLSRSIAGRIHSLQSLHILWRLRKTQHGSHGAADAIRANHMRTPQLAVARHHEAAIHTMYTSNLPRAPQLSTSCHGLLCNVTVEGTTVDSHGMRPVTTDMHCLSTGCMDRCTGNLLLDNVMVDACQVEDPRSDQSGTADGFTNAVVLLENHGVVAATGEQSGCRASNRSTADDGYVTTHQV